MIRVSIRDLGKGERHALDMVRSVGVIGGGLCGLATTCELLALAPGLRVTIYDPECRHGVARRKQGFFATASALAAGLLHPLTPKLRLAWEGEAAMAATAELMQAVGAATLSDTVVRPCRDEADAVAAREAAGSLGPRFLEWLDPSRLEGLLQSPATFGGVRLVGGCVVDVPRYLVALWASVADRVEWVEDFVSDPRALPHDVVVCCGGALAAELFSQELGGVSLSVVRSQSLTVPAPAPPVAVLRGDYICPTAEPGLFIVGATRDRIPADAKLDRSADPVDVVQARLKPAYDLVEQSFFAPPLDVAAGARLDGPRTHEGRLPFVVARSGIVLAGGLGARGLLRHAQVARLAATAALTGDDRHVPPQLKPKR